MKRVKVALVLLLAVAGASLFCRAQGTPKVLYYWLAQDRVLLWLAPGSEAPVEATYNPSDEKWTLAPPSGAEGNKSQEQWRPALQEVAQRYDPQVDLEKTRDEQLLGFAVSKLCAECDNMAWASPRTPTVYIYVRLTSKDTADVAILRNDAPRSIIKFTFTTPRGLNNGMWTPQKEYRDLTPQKLLGPSVTEAAAQKIFGLRESERPQPGVQWQPAWDQLIREALTDKRNVRHIFFTGADDKPQWLWRGRINAEADLEPPHMSAPEKIATPELPHKNTPGQSWWQRLEWWHYLLFAVALLLVVLLRLLVRLFWYVWVKRGSYTVREMLLWRKRDPSRQKPAWQGFFSWLPLPRRARHDASPPVLSLERLHKLALRHCKETTLHGDPARELRLVALEFVYQLYGEPAFLNKLKSDTEDQRKEITDEYRKQLGVEKSDKEEDVKLWIELGKKVKSAEERVSRLDVPEDVRRLLQGDALNRPRAPEHWPALLSAFQQSLAECVNKKTELADKERQLREGRAKFEQDIEEALKSEWKTRIDKLEEEKKTLGDDRDRTAADLKSANITIDGLTKKVEGLEGELNAARTNDSSARDELQVVQAKLTEIGKVKEVARHLRRWLQDYHQKEGNGDIRSSAFLSALINFSLYQMCFSIVNDERAQLKYVAHNISRSLQVFQPPHGNSSVLKKVQRILAELAPELESALDAVGNRDSEGTTDDALFLGFLNHLKTDTGKNMGRFFLDVDKDGKHFVYVAAT